jgi:hypothetical protein
MNEVNSVIETETYDVFVSMRGSFRRVVLQSFLGGLRRAGIDKPEILTALHEAYPKEGLGFMAAAVRLRDKGGVMRPTSWRGSGKAVQLVGGKLCAFPKGKRYSSYSPMYTDLVGYWEVVTKSEVQGERR